MIDHHDRLRDVKLLHCTAQKIKFSIKDFFSKCDQNHRKLWIWSHIPKKSLMENFIFCAVLITALRSMGLCYHIYQKDFIKLTLGQFAAEIYKDDFNAFSL